MGILDALFGRKEQPAATDGLFKLPDATLELQQTGFAYAGKAGVCFRPFDTVDFEQTKADILKVLAGGDLCSACRTAADEYGYMWIVVEGDLETAVASIHAIYEMLGDEGYGRYILCSVFKYEKGSLKLYWIFNKKGRFYPFAPAGRERDVPLELRMKALAADLLPAENALSQWYPLWDMPF
jgi:hypothetical protein